MANHSATKKSIRKIAVKTAHRRSILSAVKTSIKKFEQVVSSNEQEKMMQAHKTLQSQLMKACKRKLLHKNAVSRKLSRLTLKMKKANQAS